MDTNKIEILKCFNNPSIKETDINNLSKKFNTPVEEVNIILKNLHQAGFLDRKSRKSNELGYRSVETFSYYRISDSGEEHIKRIL